MNSKIKSQGDLGLRFTKNSDIVSRKISNEHLLVPIRRTAGDINSIYTLNEVASRVWSLIDGKKTVANIRDEIVDEFEVDLKIAEVDLLELFQKLVDVGAIHNVKG